MTATVYAIAGGKGGVGKTTTVANLGATLSAMGQAVALVDADLAMPNLHGVLDISHEPTLHEVLGDTASLADARVTLGDVATARGSDVVASGGRLDLYPGSDALDTYAAAESDQLEDVVERLSLQYTSIIIDTGPGLTRDVVRPLTLANSIIVVTTPAEPAVSDTQKTVDFVTHISSASIEAGVVSRICGGLSTETISKRLGIDQLTTIPAFTVPAREILAAYRRLAVRLRGETEMSVDATAARTGPAAVLTPMVLSQTEVAPGMEAEETEEADETTSESVPDWFTGVID